VLIRRISSRARVRRCAALHRAGMVCTTIVSRQPTPRSGSDGRGSPWIDEPLPGGVYVRRSSPSSIRRTLKRQASKREPDARRCVNGRRCLFIHGRRASPFFAPRAYNRWLGRMGLPDGRKGQRRQAGFVERDRDLPQAPRHHPPTLGKREAMPGHRHLHKLGIRFLSTATSWSSCGAISSAKISG